MKLGPVTKPDNRNKTTSKTFSDDAMPENCDAIDIFPIYGQFGAIQKQDSRCLVCKTWSVTFYLTKTETKTKKSNTALTLLL